MTKREKIISYLVENGIRKDMLDCYIYKRWDKPGTIVLSGILPNDWRKLYFDIYRDNPDTKIDIHQIRVNFEWQYGCYRISWVGD